MSDRQALADHGTGLCLWGLGLLGFATTIPVQALLVSTIACMDMLKRSKHGRAKDARKAALDALTNPASEEDRVSDEGVRVALNLLKDYKIRIAVDPATLKDQAQRADFPETLYRTYFGTPEEPKLGVPKDGDAAKALKIVMREAWNVLRFEDETHKLLAQESLAYIEDELRGLGENVEKARDEIAVMHTEVSAARDAVGRQDSKLDTIIHLLTEKHAEEIAGRERLVVDLAQRYLDASPDDFDAALRGLERALEVAAQRSPGGNLDAEVQAIMAEVDRLNEEESLEAGTAALRQAREARKERIAAEQAAYVALLDKGIAQAVLARSVEDAVGCELEKLELEVPDRAARFEALRADWADWFERGRDKGLGFDLEVSIALAQASVDLAEGADQLGDGLNDLGIALVTLGQREHGTARLEEAGTAFRAALEEWTRDRVPLGWAITLNNLGNALWTLGEREDGTARLEEAVTFYRAALEERTRDRVPLGWAETQMNLGNALSTLGERERGTARLEEAVTAYRAALQERTRNRVPLDWAATQNNLGTALRTLGQRESGTARLEEAVTAYRAALEERTRDRVPLGWAMTQNNLGNALSTLGQREHGTARLEEAVTAYRAALKERTHDRVPLDWAKTQENLAILHESWAETVTDDDRVGQLNLALAHVDAALEVFSSDQAPFYHNKATALRDDILSALSE